MSKRKPYNIGLLLLLIGILSSFGFQQIAAEPEESGPDTEEQDPVKAPDSISAIDLMPLNERRGFFLHYKSGADTPRSFPFKIQKQGKDTWVMVKKDRVKHYLVHHQGQIAISGETDLISSRHATFDPPVPIVTSDLKKGTVLKGTSTIKLHDPASGPVTDSGSCKWTLESKGRKHVNLQTGEFTVYRFRLKREIDLGTFQKVDLVTVFDYVPGRGQVRASVSQDARVLGLVGPNDDWRIERGKWIVPEMQVGSLLKETTTLYLKRYERAREALVNGNVNRVLRALKQLNKSLERVDLSITDLSEPEKQQLQPVFDQFHKAVDEAVKGDDLDQLRTTFKKVSRGLKNLVRMIGHNWDEPVRYFQCATKTGSTFRWLGDENSSECPYLPPNERKRPGGFPILFLNGNTE